MLGVFAEQERAAEAHNVQGHSAIAEGLSSGHDESQKVIISAESLERKESEGFVISSSAVKEHLTLQKTPKPHVFGAQLRHAIKILGLERPGRLRWGQRGSTASSLPEY